MLSVNSKSVMHPHHLGAALHRTQQQHRRNPSAPSLSVQPTNVPGLFSLGLNRANVQVAKAAREPRQPKQSKPSGPASAANVTASLSKSPAPVKADAFAKAVDPPAQPPASPTSPVVQHQRGRKTGPAPASKTGTGKRSASQQAQARRHKEHQPEPDAVVAAPARSSTPPPKTEAKELPVSPRKRPTHKRNNTAPSSPAVATAVASTPAPSANKAPRRRNRSKPAADGKTSEDEQPAQSIKIADKKDTTAKHLLSRSAPQDIQLSRSAAVADWDTPLKIDLKSVPAGVDSGPRTAPLDKAARFPFGDAYSPPPSPTPNNRGLSVPMTGAMFDMEDDFHTAYVTKSAGSSPNVPSARRVKVPGFVQPLTASVTMPTLSMLGMHASANASAPADLDHPALDRFRWASSSFQTGPATRILPAPGL